MKDIPSSSTTQLANLIYLRDIVIPFMEENPDLVNLDNYESCGTYRCLLGWYVKLRFDQSVWDWATKLYRRIPASVCDEEFGQEIFDQLFETEDISGSLDARKRKLYDIIEQRIGGS